MRTKSNDISKIQKVRNYLERYGSIDRQTALTHCKVWNLPLMIHNIKKALPEGVTIKLKDRKSDNSKYILIDKDGQPVFSRFIKPKAQ